MTRTPGGSSETDAPAAGINPDDFTNVIDNPLFPLSAYSQLIYEGEEIDPDTGETIQGRVEMTVLTDEKTVAE